MTIDINAETIEVLGYTLVRAEYAANPFDDGLGAVWQASLEHMDVYVTSMLPVGWRVSVHHEAFGGFAGFGDSPSEAAKDLLSAIDDLIAWADAVRKGGER